MQGRGRGRTDSSGVRSSPFCLPAISFVVAVAAFLTIANPFVSATSGGDPYSVPTVVDVEPGPNIVETTLTAEAAKVDIGNGVQAQVQTFNGQVPAPTFELEVGDTVIVHFRNQLKHPTGIHWHGIELANSVDGTPFTQDMVAPGGSFLYKFTVHAAGDLLVPPASPLLDQPGLPRAVRDDRRQGPQRGAAAAVRHPAPGRADQAARAQRHHGVQGAG